MKAKKPLFLFAFVLLVVVLVLGITGLAVAAPATAVKGTLTFLSEDIISMVPYEDGMAIKMRLTWTLDGGLVGEYTLTATWYGASQPRYFIRGEATFDGHLGDKLVAWSAKVTGSGKFDAGDVFAGKQHWKSTLFEGGKGQITIHDRFGHEDGSDYTVYTGELKWK